MQQIKEFALREHLTAQPAMFDMVGAAAKYYVESYAEDWKKILVSSHVTLSVASTSAEETEPI